MARKLAVLILVLVVLDVPFVSAQVSTSSITGAVTDASGAVVASAKVEAKNEETGVVFDQNTTSSGNYSFAGLTNGSYTVTPSKPGFTFSPANQTITINGSPVRHGKVDSTLYSTSSMLRTIELCLGLEPMSQFDAAARPMYHTFQPKADTRAYVHAVPKADLNEKNKPDAWGAKPFEAMCDNREFKM